MFLVDPVIKREQDDTKKRRARKAQDSHREKQRVNSWQMKRQEMFFIELVESACGPSYPIIPASSQQIPATTGWGQRGGGQRGAKEVGPLSPGVKLRIPSKLLTRGRPARPY